MIIGWIFRQSYDDRTEKTIEISNGEYQRITCEDCNGTGVFEVHGMSWRCNVCKGEGAEWFNVY